ncbi:alpha/beta fold hydrolase [Methanoregula sp.]|jgi:pimeloyl-ACP methyl ester carboxylesterase|uniref:alpha/beta fold hydrolase n=1 Tax=Methanoregula sp. TaxID=2052170 RepID=UPI003C22EB15
MQKVISKDGTQIAFDKMGKGPALILVGGAFHSRSDPRMTQLAKLMSKYFTIYHYDRRGRGDSTNTQPYAVEREVEDLNALIKDSGGSVHVFGMSSGAVLALHAAARGLDIKKLALYEPPFNSGDDDARQVAARYTKQLTLLLSEGRRSDAVELARASFGTPPNIIDGMKQTPVWSMFMAVAPTLAYDNEIMGDGSLPKKLIASVIIPLLVIDGGASPLFMRNAAKAVGDAAPRAQYRTLDGQTHEFDPDILAPVLIEFFAS